MSAHPPDPGAADSTWIRTLADFLHRESGLEAILVDPQRHAVSLATLGNVDSSALQAKLAAILKKLDAAHVAREKPATGGGPPNPGGISVRLLPHETLLEKPSCPTAPHF